MVTSFSETYCCGNPFQALFPTKNRAARSARRATGKLEELLASAGDKYSASLADSDQAAVAGAVHETQTSRSTMHTTNDFSGDFHPASREIKQERRST